VLSTTPINTPMELTSDQSKVPVIANIVRPLNCVCTHSSLIISVSTVYLRHMERVRATDSNSLRAHSIAGAKNPNDQWCAASMKQCTVHTSWSADVLVAGWPNPWRKSACYSVVAHISASITWVADSILLMYQNISTTND
jgi:hypothetical protein